jgi:hypothetical protein
MRVLALLRIGKCLKLRGCIDIYCCVAGIHMLALTIGSCLISSDSRSLLLMRSELLSLLSLGKFRILHCYQLILKLLSNRGV